MLRHLARKPKPIKNLKRVLEIDTCSMAVIRSY